MRLYICTSLVTIFTLYFVSVIRKRYCANNYSTMTAKVIENTKPFPSFFFSHGGPTFMYENDSTGNKGAWKYIKKLGTKIKNEWKPDYVVVVSAHWQSNGPNVVEIGVPPQKDGENPLIYDFYGFPSYMYKEEFHTKNSRIIADDIKSHLKSNGFDSTLSTRGIDHGVWVPFKVAFSDYNTQAKQQRTEELDLPDTAVIQVSLTSSDKDFARNYRLGELLSRYRNNLIWDEVSKRYLKGLVIFSGMSVHNLVDLRNALAGSGHEMPYVKPFNELLTKTIETDSTLEAFENIRENHQKLLYDAHPTLEHFLPVVVGGGLAHASKLPVKEVYTDTLGSLGWSIYQFGKTY